MQVKKHDDTPTKKQRVNMSPRFVGNMLLLLIAVVVVVSLGILSTQGHTVAQSATPSTPAQVAATPARAAVKVLVTLAEFSITSSVTTFHVGTPYYFVVTNQGHSLHEFFIMPDKPDGSTYVVNGEYEGNTVQGQAVKPGTTLMVNYMFSPSSTTRYEIACLMRGHYAAGMSRPIVVTK
ncbi:MAG: hypothetical protein NVS4B11_34430 [Ktedonobacteraceae bacterium]